MELPFKVTHPVCPTSIPACQIIPVIFTTATRGLRYRKVQMWSRGLLLKRPMPSFFTWGQSVLTQSLLRSNGQKSCFESSQAKVNWILLLIVNYSSKNLTESWQKLRHPAAGIFPSSTCAQPAGGLAATLQQECKEQEKVKSQWHLFMLMKHKSIFFFYFLNTVWPCAFNVWYPHFDKQHEVFLSHVFLSVPLLPPFPLSLPFTTLTLSSISKLKRHQICLWRKVLSNHFREVFFFSFRGRTCEISQPQTSVGGHNSVQIQALILNI